MKIKTIIEYVSGLKEVVEDGLYPTYIPDDDDVMCLEFINAEGDVLLEGVPLSEIKTVTTHFTPEE